MHNLLDSFNEEIAADKEAYEKTMQAAATWRARWPNHCKACGGWGGTTFNQTHPYGSTTTQEQIHDPCEATASVETCHRCGHDGLDADGNGPCKHCGWNYDDGEPQW